MKDTEAVDVPNRNRKNIVARVFPAMFSAIFAVIPFYAAVVITVNVSRRIAPGVSVSPRYYFLLASYVASVVLALFAATLWLRGRWKVAAIANVCSVIGLAASNLFI